MKWLVAIPNFIDIEKKVSSTKLSTKFEYERHLVVVAFIPLISLFESIKHCDTIKERAVNIIIDIKVGIIPHFWMRKGRHINAGPKINEVLQANFSKIEMLLLSRLVVIFFW